MLSRIARLSLFEQKYGVDTKKSSIKAFEDLRNTIDPKENNFDYIDCNKYKIVPKSVFEKTKKNFKDEASIDILAIITEDFMTRTSFMFLDDFLYSVCNIYLEWTFVIEYKI